MRRKQTLTVVAAALVVIASAAITVQAGQLTTASPAPPYMAGQGDRFNLLSNDRFTNARHITAPTPDTGNLNKPPGKGEPYGAIWTKKCTRDQRSASFRRTVQLPGPPSTATWHLMYAPNGIRPGPLRRYKLLINGERAAGGRISDTGNRIDAKLGQAQLALFEDGANVIELKVTRGALPEGVRRCNTSKKNLVGVQFSFDGEFVADLALTDRATVPQYFKARAPQRIVVLNLSLGNKGPSGAVAGGTFLIRHSGFTSVFVASNIEDPPPGIAPMGPPFASCATEPNTITCDLTHVKKGDSGTLSLGLKKEFPNTDFAEHTSKVTWSAIHPADEDITNSNREVFVIWCGDRATSPGCASAQ